MLLSQHRHHLLNILRRARPCGLICTRARYVTTVQGKVRVLEVDDDRCRLARTQLEGCGITHLKSRWVWSKGEVFSEKLSATPGVQHPRRRQSCLHLETLQPRRGEAWKQNPLQKLAMGSVPAMLGAGAVLPAVLVAASGSRQD